MSNNKFAKPSRLALRFSLILLAASGILSFIIIALLLHTPLLQALLTAVLIGVITSGVTYASIYYLQVPRLLILNRIYESIARKRFQDYEHLRTADRDEVDQLISKSVEASKTIEREIQRLNRIENYRKEFIGDLSHELKTPIFAIQGFIETLLNGAIDDEDVNRKFLKKAMRNVNRLIYLTKDLMDISKLETGELRSDVQEISISDIINEVVDSLQYKARDENITLHVDRLPKDQLVFGDRNQIKQVLANLVENAIKYNKPGGDVRIGIKEYGNEEQRLLVYVEDTGIGINQQFIDRVTERFFRVDKSRSREKGGTGLGLAIVKHIMEAHDEEFFIDSTPNVGSTFSFTLTKTQRDSQETLAES